jgi:peptidoglycan/xylan/chitin deacetylase (PgdA/CDA1 family)
MSARIAAVIAAVAALALVACRERQGRASTPNSDAVAASGEVVAPTSASGEAGPAPARPVAARAAGAGEAPTPATAERTPNELGRIPVLEYHLLGDTDARWKVSRQRFRENLALLYARGYRPVTISQLLDKKLDLPAGLSPVVIVFDDASPAQFSYVERDGRLEVDPNSGVGMLLDFHRQHPDWENRAVFCVLPAAQQGHAFFGDRGIGGQKTEWRFKKLQFLREQGFEICNHTLYHANLGKQTDEKAQEFIARGQMAIDSAVPGYKVRTFALPLGVWPRNASLGWAGSWREPRSGKVVAYKYDAVLEVSGGPTRSPYDPQFDPRHVTRVEVFARELEKWLDYLDRSGARYVSDGNPATIARPAAPVTVASTSASRATGQAATPAASRPAKGHAKRATKRVAAAQ